MAKYVGSWTDNAKGQQIAQAEFRDGADILFAAAGKSGLGVLDEANNRGAGFFGKPHETRGTFADLADIPGRAL